MRLILILLSLQAVLSCSAPRLGMPDDFRTHATRMPVKGLNGWMLNQQLYFGDFKTSKIKRGWDFSSSLQYTKFSMKPEESILKVFEMDTDKRNLKQKNKYHYTIEGESAIAEVYATERFTEKQLVYKSNNPWIGGASKTKKYEYAFTSIIVPLDVKNTAPWSLVLINTFDINRTRASNTARAGVEEEGYATNGTESFAISPLRVDEVENKGGKVTKLVGGSLLGGYQVSVDNKPVTIIDLLDHSIWISAEVDQSKKIILSSIASAILLKRIQDVDKDKNES